MGQRSRKFISLLLCAALLLCGGCQKESSTQTVRIGVALYKQDDTFLSTLVQNLEQIALVEEETRDIQVTLNMAYARENQSTQNDQVDSFLSQGYDIICVNTVDRTAAAVIIDKAQTAGVPVIFFNREPVQEDLDRWDNAYYVGSNATIGGSIQGQIISDEWWGNRIEMDKNHDGILQYVMLEGEAGHQDALLRSEACIHALTQEDVSVEKLDTDIANWQRGQGKATMANWIEKFGDEIEAVLSNNDDMALGAIDAYLDAGIDIDDFPFIVGVDGIPAALEAIEAGYMQGTVLNDGAGQAQSILDLAISLTLDGAPSDDISLVDGTYIWHPYTAITP